ncbi:hypothetical protein GCM10009863_48540 [Streptomyces axinellae]|uniref:Transposase n=1 Tax=Streptomyces axinellae TaxID=552788 RepID=A0ABP6CZ03_9ACTN
MVWAIEAGFGIAADGVLHVTATGLGTRTKATGAVAGHGGRNKGEREGKQSGGVAQPSDES